MTRPAEQRGRRGDAAIENASAWILRFGVVTSVAVMNLGLALGFLRGEASLARMQSRRFSADFGAIWRGSLAGNGTALVELGILLLVLTPILRVASSMVVFAAGERDWLHVGEIRLLLLAGRLT